MGLIARLFSLKANLGSLFGGGGGSQVANIQTPSYYTNPTYTQTTQNLANLSANILSGNLPSYYSNLGNPNSSQFQAEQQNLIGQTNQASQQQAAASGTDRSGVAASAAASSLADTLPGLDYSNSLNAQQQQEGLLILGTGIDETVQSSSLNQQENQNAFNQQNFQDQYEQASYNNSYNQMMSQQLGSLIGTTVGGIGGFMIGGPAGALAGAGLGSSIGGGGGNGLNNASSAVSLFNGLNNVGQTSYASSTPTGQQISAFGGGLSPYQGISPSQLASLGSVGTSFSM